MWLLSGDEVWQVVEPQTLRLPVVGEIRVRLRKQAMTSVQGRVVDTRGRAIVAASVKARVMVPMVTGQEETRVAQARFLPTHTTDEKGAFTVPDVRRGTTVALLVSQPGYIYKSGGQVTEVAGAYRTTDVVLAPLTARMEGTVTDANNTPVGGASVFSPDGGPDALTKTDAAGKFVLEALSEGEVTVIAAHGDTVATVKARTGTGATIELKPRQVLPGRDVFRAQ
jgi:hypothetical protein